MTTEQKRRHQSKGRLVKKKGDHMLFLFDIDGTVTDPSHRRHLVEGEVKDWEAFYAASAGDQPIWSVITVARALHDAGHILVYSTGRPDSIRMVSQKWMDKYRLPKGAMYMRANGDHREDFVVKAELFDRIKAQYPKETIGGVFEDRQQVVDMYRARGLRVFQVDKGAF
jgi:hypothetical protein